VWQGRSPRSQDRARHRARRRPGRDPRARPGGRALPEDRHVADLGDPVVGIIMGSDSDWPTMEAASLALKEFDVAHEVHVRSAHRTPVDMLDYASSAADRGLRVIIAGAGGAAHLPGMVAS